MSLIKCPECGKEISDKAVSCPGCGCPSPYMRTANVAENHENVNSKGRGGIYLGKSKTDGYTMKEREKIAEYKDRGVAYCPKCLSTSIQYTDKKLSIGRAIVGNTVAGDTGAILGGLTSKKGRCVCLSCGNRWKI